LFDFFVIFFFAQQTIVNDGLLTLEVARSYTTPLNSR